MPRVSIAGGTLVGMKQLGWRGWLDPKVYQPAASTGRWLSNVWATAIKLGMAKWPPRRSRGPRCRRPSTAPSPSAVSRQGDGQLCCAAGIVDDQGLVGPDRVASCELGNARQEPGCCRRTRDTMDFGIIECPPDRVPYLLGRQGVSLGQWHAHEHPRVEAEVEVHAGETCRGPHVGDGCRRRDPARAGEEARDLARSDRQDRHTARLEVFDRRSNVEDRLGTSAYDDDG